METIKYFLEAYAELQSLLPIHEFKELRKEYRKQVDRPTRKFWRQHMRLAREQALIYARAYLALAIRKRPKKK